MNFNYAQINPGLKRDVMQSFTITASLMGGEYLYFLTYDESRDAVIWNQPIYDVHLKGKLENILRSYLTNPKDVLYYL